VKKLQEESTNAAKVEVWVLRAYISAVEARLMLVTPPTQPPATSMTEPRKEPETGIFDPARYLRSHGSMGKSEPADTGWIIIPGALAPRVIAAC
jgi:hypothetical protein